MSVCLKWMLFGVETVFMRFSLFKKFQIKEAVRRKLVTFASAGIGYNG